jgi:hypothetical protein
VSLTTKSQAELEKVTFGKPECLEYTYVRMRGWVGGRGEGAARARVCIQRNLREAGKSYLKRECGVHGSTIQRLSLYGAERIDIQ